jgi:hypothetical protein
VVYWRIILAVIGLILVDWNWRTIWNGRRSLLWPSTKGEMKESRMSVIEETSDYPPYAVIHRTHTLEMRYRYEVDGKAYEGFRLSFASQEVPEKRVAQVTKRYGKGSTPMVFYDPKRPELSVLEAGTGLWTCIALSVGLIDLIVLAVDQNLRWR